MIIEFQNCDLEIAHIGSPIEIATQIAVEIVQSLGEAIHSIVDRIQPAIDSMAECLGDMIQSAIPILTTIPMPPAVIEAQRVVSEVSKKTWVPYNVCLDAWARVYHHSAHLPEEADVMRELGSE